MPSFYYSDSKFNSLQFMGLPDKELLTFIRLNNFSPNADWAPDNTVLHNLLANELFYYAERLLILIPERINPNLCDGPKFGKKSLLILLTLLPSSGSLIFKFIDRYQKQLLLDYQDEQGKTALHYAIILGRADVVDRLMTLRASIKICDNKDLSPFDYLHCPTEIIKATLKMVDIEPLRDTNASRNTINDHAGRPLMLQGEYLIQCKTIIQNLRKANLILIKYIEGHTTPWGTFIGDDDPTTSSEMQKLAKAIAKHYQLPWSDIFVNQKLSGYELQAFRATLEKSDSDFSGKSILEQCIAGHDKIADLLLAPAGKTVQP